MQSIKIFLLILSLFSAVLFAQEDDFADEDPEDDVLQEVDDFARGGTIGKRRIRLEAD